MSAASRERDRVRKEAAYEARLAVWAKRRADGLAKLAELTSTPEALARRAEMEREFEAGVPATYPAPRAEDIDPVAPSIEPAVDQPDNRIAA